MRNKSGKMIFVFLFLFLFLINFSSAVPPVQTTTNPSIGIDVEYSNYDVAKENTNFTLYTHAFNKSDGLILTTAVADCNLHIYGSNGKKIFDADFSENGHEFWVDINNSVFTNLGIHSYIIHCNATNIGGFASGNFNVTPTGQTNLYNFYVIIFILSAGLIIFGWAIKDPWIIILGSFGFTFCGLFVINNGIVGIQDMVTTWAIGIIILAVAAYTAIRAALEVVNG